VFEAKPRQEQLPHEVSLSMEVHAVAGSHRGRDPEDRLVDETSLGEIRDKMFDKTLADSFPASDPPSTLPDPSQDSFCLSGQPD
jgi:hypothetical protein